MQAGCTHPARRGRRPAGGPATQRPVRAGTGVKASLLGTTKRKSGQRQVTYRGHPLYRFKLDKSAGSVAGQGQNFFGGKWWLLNAAGRAVKKTTGGGGGTTGTTTTGTTGTTTSPYP